MKTDTITFTGELNDNVETEVFYKQCKHLSQNMHLLPDKLIIEINSNGGDVGTAIRMHKALRKINNNTVVETRNIGVVQSSAIIMFLAADIRIANIETTFMIHRLWRDDDHIDLLNQDIVRYADIFEERTVSAVEKVNIRDILRGNYVSPLGDNDYRFDWRDSTELGITTHDEHPTRLVHFTIVSLGLLIQYVRFAFPFYALRPVPARRRNCILYYMLWESYQTQNSPIGYFVFCFIEGAPEML